MSNLFVVVVLHEIYVWIGGGGGVSLPLVYVHSSICESYLVLVVFQRSISEWRRGCIHSTMGIGAFFSMSNLFLIMLFHIYICWIGGR